MRHPHTIGTPLGVTLIPEVGAMDGMGSLQARVRDERRHPTLPLRRVGFGELLTVMIGHAPTNIGTLRRMLPR